ncbi:(2Fe-2S)-binding protein [Reinekea sp.]|jgi:isoquinoline 1-oxidoreductase alpha subunit|uniref:(2Fe-2S)-binding protein n=1 Tax=Reinekea sp. TaxID=1970455 RepID=UPI0039893A48
MFNLTVNAKAYQADVEADTPLLWVIRESLGLTGTKFGCGLAQCGACTMLINGEPTRTCVYPVSALPAGAEVTTIEGVTELTEAPAGETGVQHWHPVQQAWLDEQVPQCGYCQSGQILTAVALLNKNPQPSEEDIENAMINICRCGTYPRIRTAVHRAAQLMQEANS